MLTESPQVPPNNWAHLFPTKIQEKEDPVAASEEEYSDSDAVSDGDGSEDSVDSEDNQDEESYISHRRDKAKAAVTDFLKQVKENKFGEFQWPPPPKCPLYKLGYTSHYADEYWFENEMHKGKKYNNAKKYLKQVRTSWGYDVDCFPSKRLRATLFPTFFPINMDNERILRIYGERITRFANTAIERINTQAKEIGKTFELVKIEKAVRTATTVLLLTLTIKEKDSDAEKAIRVAVSSPCGCGGPEIMECNLIPSLSSA